MFAELVSPHLVAAVGSLQAERFSAYVRTSVELSELYVYCCNVYCDFTVVHFSVLHRFFGVIVPLFCAGLQSS